jgi:hypothetical protein
MKNIYELNSKGWLQPCQQVSDYGESDWIVISTDAIGSSQTYSLNEKLNTFRTHSWSLYYKTYYGPNLQIFVIS